MRKEVAVMKPSNVKALTQNEFNFKAKEDKVSVVIRILQNNEITPNLDIIVHDLKVEML